MRTLLRLTKPRSGESRPNGRRILVVTEGTMDTEKYKMGWLVVTFDLPVGSKKQRKQATDFRNYLLDDGYQMIQFSVYARACVTLLYPFLESRQSLNQMGQPKNRSLLYPFLESRQSANQLGNKRCRVCSTRFWNQGKANISP